MKKRVLYTTFYPSKVDKATRSLLESVMAAHGFKWSYQRGTDLCREDMDVELGSQGVLTVTFKKQMSGNFFGRSGSVFSKGVGNVSRIEVPRDLKNALVMVFVKSPVTYYDWDGTLTNS